MRMRAAIKYVVVGLVIGTQIVEEQVLSRVLMAFGKNPTDTVWDEIGVGATLGIVLFVILTVSDRAKEHEKRRARMIAEMNHHIRNALQVIQFGLTGNSALPPEHMKEAVKRIEWALREVLPDKQPGKEYRHSLSAHNS